jgi:hypothetical protein
VNSSAYRDGNEQIADFNLRKSEAIFANGISPLSGKFRATRFRCVKIAALFHAIKSAIFLFPSRSADFITCAFLSHFLEIADFIFDCSSLRIFVTLLGGRLLMRLRRIWGAAPCPARGLLAPVTPRQRTGAGSRVRVAPHFFWH